MTIWSKQGENYKIAKRSSEITDQSSPHPWGGGGREVSGDFADIAGYYSSHAHLHAYSRHLADLMLLM